MERYEGTKMIKTFRGMIADNGTDPVILHTNTGAIGYRISKFEIIPNDPYAGGASEHIVKVYKIKQTAAPTATIDFSDNTLLAVAVFANTSTGHNVGSNPIIIFDQEIFNQDIYITHIDNGATSACNYYLELEQVKLDLNQNTVATLKDIRNVTAP